MENGSFIVDSPRKDGDLMWFSTVLLPCFSLDKLRSSWTSWVSLCALATGNWRMIQLTHTYSYWFYMHMIFIPENVELMFFHTDSYKKTLVQECRKVKSTWTKQPGEAVLRLSISSLRLRGPDWNFRFLFFMAASSWPGCYLKLWSNCDPMMMIFVCLISVLQFLGLKPRLYNTVVFIILISSSS